MVRFTGPKLELFVDGVLVDEEFPVGTTRPSTAPLLIGAAATTDGTRAGFHGLVDHVALWDRALSDGEITALSGGASEVARRRGEILGTGGEQLQYWRPPGHNARAGDCMPFFDGREFHLYYLVVRRNHHGKWQSGHGGLQIWHASTRDLRRWRQHPIAAPISEQWQSWWGTGSFALHEGTWFTYQKGPSLLPEQPCGGVQLATSNDGVHFTAQPPHPALPGYDCDIFHDVTTGTYHLLTTDGNTAREVAVVRWTSRDLRNWTRGGRTGAGDLARRVQHRHLSAPVRVVRLVLPVRRLRRTWRGVDVPAAVRAVAAASPDTAGHTHRAEDRAVPARTTHLCGLSG